MLEALLQWIDTEQLFTVLAEKERGPGQETLPAAQPIALPDQVLLKQLLPLDLYREAMRTGWMGMHASSFALRHRVTQLQLLFHLPYPDVDPGLRLSLLESWQRRHGNEFLPVFGFSPLGIYSCWRRSGLCRAFDAFSFWSCAEPTADIFCEAHATETFWAHSADSSQQALMFRYYADLKNFSLYNETDLEQMLGTFWERYRIYADGDLDQALEYFGIRNSRDLGEKGLVELRRKFLQLSLIHHPDRGGDETRFIELQSHYYRLKGFLKAQ